AVLAHDATSTPMLRAVPAMIFAAASTSFALRSGSLRSAISRSWAWLIVPTFVRLGSPEPLGMRRAWRISTAAGGVLVMNVNERSSYTVITTGITVPVSLCVCALKALQNSMMLIPCCPSAGPTGGAGLACPAFACSLIVVRTFLAIGYRLKWLSVEPAEESGQARTQEATCADRRPDAITDRPAHERPRTPPDADHRTGQ